MFEVRVHEDCTNISGRVYRINNLESGEAGRIYSIRGLCFRLESPELSGCIIPKDIQSEIQSYKQRDQQRRNEWLEQEQQRLKIAGYSKQDGRH